MKERKDFVERPGDKYGHGANPYEEVPGVIEVEADIKVWMDVVDNGADEDQILAVMNDIANHPEVNGVHYIGYEEVDD